MKPRHISWLGAAGLALGVSGCLYVPRSTQVLDEECQIQAHHMTIAPEVPQVFVNCDNQGRGALLAATGVVTAASAVVSGSIVVAGSNIVYWFEKQGRCNRPSTISR
jgi:hypothetical protein